jgi:competence protein ComFC
VPGSHVGQVCLACIGALPRIAEPVCLRCGMELVSERGVCTRCRLRVFEFDRNVALFPYLGEARELVRQYKLAGRPSLAELFAELLAGVYRRHFDGMPVVPVPGRAAVIRERGWEHVDLLASWLERRHGVAVRRCLRRGTSAETQKSLDFEGRMRNIRGTFALGNLGELGVPGEVLLLDDVLTTGATLSECARLLRERGARAVCAMTIAVDE